MKPSAGLAHATFQHMRDTQCLTDLACVMPTAILHHAAATDDFKGGNVCQLGQKVILEAISERGVLPVVTEVFKRQHRDSRCSRASEKVTFPNVPANHHCQSDQ